MKSTKVKRVVAFLKGGLGNQCFIYAAARSLAERAGAEVAFSLDYFPGDKTYRRSYDLGAFKVRGEILPMNSWIVRQAEELRYKMLRRFKISRMGNFCCDHLPFMYRPLPLNWRGDLILDGYWHSYGYYRDGIAGFAGDFKLADPSHPILKDSLYARVKDDGKSIFCHVRSYKEVPGHADGGMSAADSYYREALGVMAARIGSGGTCYLFSDDLAWAAGRVGEEIKKAGFALVPVEGASGMDNQLRDFMLMSACRNGIVGNSSFSGFAGVLAWHRHNGVFTSPPNMIADYFPDKWVNIKTIDNN